jgi:hypothetical protein
MESFFSFHLYPNNLVSALYVYRNIKITKLLYQMSDDYHKLNEDTVIEIKEVMVDNIKTILERGEKMEHVVNKSKELEDTSIRFKKNSNKLKTKMKHKHLICIGCSVLVVIAIILAIVYLSTGKFIIS